MQTNQTNMFSGRWTVIIIFAVFVIGTYAVTWVSVHHPKAKEYKAGKLIPIITCKQIIDSESILVNRQGTEVVVRFLGIDSPLSHTNKLKPGLAAAHEEVVACKVLQTWVFRRRIELQFPNDEEIYDKKGRLVAYVSIFGVDVSRKLLREGQMFLSETPHPRLEHYRDCEEEGRTKQKGIWRD
jgi:endonuclease YncB( thermonuclease family)